MGPVIWRLRLAAAAAAAVLPAPSAAWDYTRQGADWGNLGFCGYPGALERQSPINIPLAVPVDPEYQEVVLHYPLMKEATQIYATEHSLALTFPESYKGGFGLAKKVMTTKEQLKELVKPDAKAFRLWQMEFHSPSEHKLNGVRTPLEVQFSHKRADSDERAVVSLLFDIQKGEENSFLNGFISAGLPSGPWKETNIAFAQGLNIQQELDKSLFFMYDGSFTTPPCEVGVRWLVRRSVVGASMSQIMAFKNVLELLAPPTGNIRGIPQGTLAFQNLFVLSSSSMSDKDIKKAKYGKDGGKDGEGGALSAAAAGLADNPLFQTLDAGDSDELAEAKTNYKAAKLDDTSARSGKAQAARLLRQAKDLYDTAPGLVGKIDLKWDVIAAENNYKSMVAQADTAKVALKAKALDGAKLLNKQEEKKYKFGEKIDAIGGEGEMKVNYSPRVYLPSGAAGNPFLLGLGNSQVLAGPETTSQATRQYSRLQNNLMQPARSEGLSPVPEVVVLMPTDTPAVTTPSPAQVTFRLVVPKGKVKDEQALAYDLSKAMADDVDKKDRIMVAEARRIAL